jgi:hypothetical protein
MRHPSRFSCVVVCALLLPACAAAGGAASKEELRQRLTDAYSKKDAGAIEALIYWPPGRPDPKADRAWHREVLELVFEMGAGEKLVRSEIKDVEKDQMTSATKDGVTYALPLPPTGRIVLHMEPVSSGASTVTSASSFLIVDHEGRFYLDVALPSKAN